MIVREMERLLEAVDAAKVSSFPTASGDLGKGGSKRRYGGNTASLPLER